MSKEDLLYYTHIAIQMDYRFQVCTFTLLGDVWTHQEHKCPKCIANYIINEMQ